MKVIAFKLTKTESPEKQLRAVKKISGSVNIDYVIHNELSEIHGHATPFPGFQGRQ